MGKIIALQNGKLEVKFMRKIPSKKMEYVFIWPENEDTDSVFPDAVKGTLGIPKLLRRGRYQFYDSFLKA